MILINKNIWFLVLDQVLDQDLVQDEDILFGKNNGIGFEMGPYGSIWARINTGRSLMAHEHF